MNFLMNLLAGLGMLAAMLLAVVGLLFLTEATAGVGIIGFACACGIVARILQAEANHHSLMASHQQLLEQARQRDIEQARQKNIAKSSAKDGPGSPADWFEQLD